MKKEKVIFWLSIFIILIIFSGFPVGWRKYIILASSLLVTILSYLVIKEKSTNEDLNIKEKKIKLEEGKTETNQEI